MFFNFNLKFKYGGVARKTRRLQKVHAMPGRRAHGEGTNKVSVRQGRGYAGALLTALRAHRVPLTVSSRWRIVRGRLRQLRAAVEVAQGVDS